MRLWRARSVGDLSEPMIDDYLGFCERALLKPENGQGTAHSLLEDYFPVARRNSDGEGITTPFIYPKHRSSAHKGDADAMRPGESYTIYSALDIFGSLPEEHELPVNRAARWVGVADEYLCRVIEKFERRVVRWWDTEKKRRKDRSKEEEEEEEEESD